MQVTHYCDNFSPLSETFIYDVIIELENQGINNNVIANKVSNQQDRPFAKVEAPQIQINKLARFRNYLLISLGLFEKGYFKLKREHDFVYDKLRKNRPDLIHCHFAPQGIRIAPIAKKLKIPFIVSFHGFDAFKLPLSAHWRQQINDLFLYADAVTVVSHFMKNHLISLGCVSEKIRVIHVGKRIEDYNTKATPPTPIKNFLSVGRMEEKKGHLDSIKVFNELVRHYPHVKLKIIGQGSMLDEARNLISSLNLQNSVLLVDGLPHNKVKEAFLNADAFILSSRTGVDGDMEGIPTVLMEAQLVGLPCISTFHSGIPEVIPECNQWLLAKEGDISGLVNIAEKLLRLSSEQLSLTINAGRVKITEEFNLANEVEKLKTLYALMCKTDS